MEITEDRKEPKPVEIHGFGAPWVYVLSVIEGGDPKCAHRIVATETVIGTDPRANFRIEDEKVGERHCVIRTEGGVCTVMDLGSPHGTRLNHRDLEPGVARRLRHLDELRVGDVRLFVMTGKYNSKVRCSG